MRTDKWIGFVVGLMAVAFTPGCAGTSVQHAWTSIDVAPDVMASQTGIDYKGEPLRAVVMMPQSHRVVASRSMPTLLILAGSGDPLGGARWDDASLADAAELARLGVIVMALDTPGAIAPDMSFGDLSAAMRRHIRSSGGAAVARSSIDGLLNSVDAADPNRIFTAGVGASGPAAAAAARLDPRVRGVILFSPELERPIDDGTVAIMETQVGGVRAFLSKRSSRAPVDVLEVPTGKDGGRFASSAGRVVTWLSGTR